MTTSKQTPTPKPTVAATNSALSDAAKAAAMQVQNLIARMRELVELQNTYASGAEASPGFAGSRFMSSSEFGTGSGVRPTGIERSHLLNRARRRAIM